MSNVPCSDCSRTFTRYNDMKRHFQKFHASERSDGPSGMRIDPPLSTSDSDKGVDPQQPIRLQHPFTMCISGPTSCGKTQLMKRILQNRAIYPSPDRIIWLYKRWQSAYNEVKRVVYPSIEFVQGIPNNLEKDDFLDVKVNNLIVLDDLMSTASKDQRVTDLFTEGSHHRNLSVIAINQNLYYSKDPTQRRNCHYIALFNNPVDQQPVLTLARQMYPRRSQMFMDAYEKAVAKPYGYLLVDLKPTTPSDQRLIPNALASAKSDQRHCAKDDDEHDWFVIIH